MKPILQLQDVSLSYGSAPVLKNINLDVEENEFVAILGFSGSGKTTLISAIAGLLAPSEGHIIFDGAPVKGASRDRGVVFQNYSLMPWLSVAGNVRLAVDAVFPDMVEGEKVERVSHYIDMVGLSHAVDRKPAELSGGMRQRVNVARALAIQPKLLLLDEPLSALDALTRANLQDEIERIWATEKKTVILITNDVDEALLLADRIIPLNPGPGATFGPAFDVNIERPRDRKDMNHDETFIRLRGEITAYLNKVGLEKTADESGPQLPNVMPLTAMAEGLKTKLRDARSSDLELPQVAIDAGEAKFNAVNKFVEFYNVSKVYDTPKGPLKVVDGFNLNLKKGEFISLIGHSGCGKSTVLSMAAGLNEISDGGIVLDAREIDGAGPDRGVVFQAPSLFPWMTAYENVALGVERVYPHASAAERRDIVEYYLTRVGLADSMDKSAADLSNGMKQRVGIARAFALSPKFLLLDEPFGMLDSLTRWELQDVLMDVWSRTQVTAICVTHDVDEAILLADRVVMMSNGPNARVGKIMEVDLPRPRTRKELLDHRDYYKYREQLLTFLEEYENEKKERAA